MVHKRCPKSLRVCVWLKGQPVKCVTCGTTSLEQLREETDPMSSFLGQVRPHLGLDMDGNGEIGSEEKRRCTCTGVLYWEPFGW